MGVYAAELIWSMGVLGFQTFKFAFFCITYEMRIGSLPLSWNGRITQRSRHQHGRPLFVWGHQYCGRDVMWNPRIIQSWTLCYYYQTLCFVRWMNLCVWWSSNVIPCSPSGKLLCSPAKEFRPVRQASRRNTAGSLLNSPLDETPPTVCSCFVSTF